MTNEKTKAVAAVVAHLEKQYGKGIIQQLGTPSEQQVAVIPTGSVGLDRALGCGGWPRGRVVEIFGPQAGGKTTLALHAVAQCQALGGVASFIDADHELDMAYARRVGVRVEDLLVSQPDTGDQSLDVCESLVRSGAIDLIVVDSVQSLVPRSELEGDETVEGIHARLMSQALRKLTAATSRSGTVIIFLNARTPGEQMTGGNSLKFYSSVRVELGRVGNLKDGDAVVGSRVGLKVVKNKCAPPFAVATFDLTYDRGVHREAEVIDLGVDCGLIEKTGSHYVLAGERIGQGRERAIEWLRERPAVTEELAQKILATPVKP